VVFWEGGGLGGCYFCHGGGVVGGFSGPYRNVGIQQGGVGLNGGS